MGQKHSYSLDRAKVTRQSTQMIEDEVALNVSSMPPRPSEPVPLGLRTSMDSSDYVRREVERQELQQKERVPGVQAEGQAVVDDVKESNGVVTVTESQACTEPDHATEGQVDEAPEGQAGAELVEDVPESEAVVVLVDDVPEFVGEDAEQVENVREVQAVDERLINDDAVEVKRVVTEFQAVVGLKTDLPPPEVHVEFVENISDVQEAAVAELSPSKELCEDVQLQQKLSSNANSEVDFIVAGVVQHVLQADEGQHQQRQQTVSELVEDEHEQQQQQNVDEKTMLVLDDDGNGQKVMSSSPACSADQNGLVYNNRKPSIAPSCLF
uniref:Uncharacterized protein n=1 Tax=Globodera rostochiensis TaxID=31243 RepID=A0A914HH43_GLORO